MSLYLRLAAPQQSWGTARISGMVVPSAPMPTRSGVLGLIAAALGAPRGQWPEWIDETSITVRVDSPGTRSIDFHTITFDPNRNERFGDKILRAASGKEPSGKSYLNPTSHAGLWKAENKNKTAVIPSIVGETRQTFTAIIKREILEGATFIVEVGHPTRMSEIVAAFADPGFSPYLGRKAFSPSFPFVLGEGESGLLDQIPTTGAKASMPIAVAGSNDRPERSNLVELVDLSGLLGWCSKELTRQ